MKRGPHQRLGLRGLGSARRSRLSPSIDTSHCTNQSCQNFSDPGGKLTNYKISTVWKFDETKHAFLYRSAEDDESRSPGTDSTPKSLV